MVLLGVLCGFLDPGYACMTTLRNFKTKKRFYKKFACAFSWWLLALPCNILVSAALPDYSRAKHVRDIAGHRRLL